MPTRHSDRWAGAHGVPLQAAENSGNVDLVNLLKKQARKLERCATLR